MINIFVNTFKPIKVFYHKTVNSIKVFLDKLFKYVSNFLKTKPLLNKITLNFVKYLVHIISLFEKYTYILFFMIFIEICFKIKTVINSNDRTLFLVYCFVSILILIGTILDFLKKRDRKYKKDIEIQKTEVIKDINDFIKKTDEQNRKNKILKDLELI